MENLSKRVVIHFKDNTSREYVVGLGAAELLISDFGFYKNGEKDGDGKDAPKSSVVRLNCDEIIDRADDERFIIDLEDVRVIEEGKVACD